MTAVESASDATNGQQAITTSYYGLGGDASLVQHIHIKWDAALVATITIESSDFHDVALNSTTAGDWVQENPSSGYTAVSPSGAATTATPLVLAIPGVTAGGASMNIGNLGSRRLRAKVVCTTGGFLRIHTNGKY